jgi:hypothetical protein
VGARAAQALFRWRQLTHSGECCDHWALDNTRVASLATPLPPQIVVQPTNQVAGAGSTVTLAVGVVGTSPFSFQWWRDGYELPNATNSALILTNIQPEDSGSYSVAVTNAHGFVVSSNALISPF